jgi:hypothetical protein
MFTRSDAGNISGEATTTPGNISSEATRHGRPYEWPRGVAPQATPLTEEQAARLALMAGLFSWRLACYKTAPARYSEERVMSID